MDEGFLLDRGHGDVRQARWCAGRPKPGTYTNEVELEQQIASVKVLAYRCPKCNRLELFAPPKE